MDSSLLKPTLRKGVAVVACVLVVGLGLALLHNGTINSSMEKFSSQPHHSKEAPATVQAQAEISQPAALRNEAALVLKQLDFEEKKAESKTLSGHVTSDTELLTAVVPEETKETTEEPPKDLVTHETKKHLQQEKDEQDRKDVVDRADSFDPQDVISAKDQGKAEKHFGTVADEQKLATGSAGKREGKAEGSARYLEDVNHEYLNHKNQWTNRQVSETKDYKDQGHHVVKEAAEKSKIEMAKTEAAAKKKAVDDKKHPEDKKGAKKGDDKTILNAKDWPVNGGNPPWAGKAKAKIDAAKKVAKQAVKKAVKKVDKNPFHMAVPQTKLQTAPEMPPVEKVKTSVHQKENNAAKENDAAKILAEPKARPEVKAPEPPAATKTLGLDSGFVTKTDSEEQATNQKQLQKAQGQLDAAVDKELKNSATDEILLGMPPPTKLVSGAALQAQVDSAVKDVYNPEKAASEAKPKDFLNEPTAFGPWLMN
jgi:hypothetical protein